MFYSLGFMDEAPVADGTPPGTLTVAEAYLAAARELTRIMSLINENDPERDDTITILGGIAEDLRDAA